MNLFALFNEVLNADVVSRIAVYIDEPVEKTHKAVDGLIYTIVGGLMKRTTTEIGVNQLFNHIKKGHYDGSLTESLPTILRDPAHTNTLITQGNDVISHLLPAMKSSIGSMISSYANIRNSSAISLLGLTTTVVLHVLGRQVRDRKLDADGLAASLFAEREAFVNAVPEAFMPRLVEKVGLQQVVAGLAAPARRTVVEIPTRPVAGPVGSTSRSIPATTRSTVTYEADDSDSDNGSLAKWAIGALLLLGVAFGGYYIYQNTQNYSAGREEASDVTVTGDTAKSDTVTRSLAVPADTVAKTRPKSTPVTALTAAAPVAAPGVSASGVAGAAGSLTQKMSPYLGNAALPKGRVFQLTGVAFQPGSLSMTAGSQAAIGELATLLKTYPALQIQLIGYANDAAGSGQTNKSLSFKRVNQIKQQLMSSGVNFVRIDAIGRGTGVSRADTSGLPKPTLRKIDVKVVVK